MLWQYLCYKQLHTLIIMLSKSYSLRLTFIALASLCTFTFCLISCTPDSAEKFEEESKPQNSFVYSAKMNGTDWKATINVSTYIKDVSPKRMDINAQSASGQRLLLSLKDTTLANRNDIPLKTYKLILNGQSDASFSYDINGSNLYQGAYGAVTITKCDSTTKKISGTFSCTLFRSSGDSLKITQGIITDLPYSIFE